MKNNYLFLLFLLFVGLVNGQTEQQLETILNSATRVSGDGEGGLFFCRV